MKLYFRLFWENHATKLMCLCILLGTYFLLSHCGVLPTKLCSNVKDPSQLIALLWGEALGLFLATGFGLSPVHRYNSLIEGHRNGRHILTRSKGFILFTCDRAAYRLALRDLGIKTPLSLATFI